MDWRIPMVCLGGAAVSALLFGGISAEGIDRKDVLEHPDATDHANIRAFMKVGWDGVKFPDGLAVTPKNLGDYVSYGPSIVDAYNNY